MQELQDVMEKGEAGRTVDLSPCPTSPTLFNTSTDTTDSIVSRSPQQRRRRRQWNLFARRKLRKARCQLPDVITRRLNDHVKGYPNVAAFLDSDEGLSVYRRFGYLQSRLLLNKQEDLRRLEKDLSRMDRMITHTDINAMCSRDLRGPHREDHEKLLREIEQKFCSYANVLTAAQQLMAFGKPAEGDRKSVARYLANRQCLSQEQGEWIQHQDDLITLRARREHAWLDDLVETFLKMSHCWLIDVLFRSKETRKKTEIDSDTMPAQPPKDEDKYEIFYTPSRISKATNCILTVLILILMIVPVYILYHMVHDIGTRHAYTTCLGILLVFTLAFSSVLSLFTKARRHEIFAAAAAYCAVLVVFLGNVGTDGPPPLGHP
ncbi:hypothetical protein K491DRAFT_313155 [Lophiostoma macrostomum CBS 122681]|uniref:DUF6594 domain-containing protein n=1 Tax=Lophiostoma macrostomum CBS 122681 TaxID=1314788 RepID=A0A6A6TDU4_9PLEO|nr:hypothetical protein K491DRAFT_313155 [Lophiostoma macrostomum CBS 122681]